MAPGLPERLLAARERKGVDLYRAERDTKIRARYLAALERGDYRELPGAVYTKGFLRNYALYLGLDPDEVLLQWRRERGAPQEPQPVIAVPRPIAAPRRGLTFSPSLIVFALLVALVIGFMVWLGFQLLRFSKPPTIAVTNPAVAVLEVDEDADVLPPRGTTIPGGSVTVKTADVAARTRSAPIRAASGSSRSTCAEARNQFRITATDPATGKQARGPGRTRDHRPVPGDRGTHPHGRPAGRRRYVRERGHTDPGPHGERRHGRRDRQRTPATARRPVGRPRRRRRRASPAPVRLSRWMRTARSTPRSS